MFDTTISFYNSLIAPPTNIKLIDWIELNTSKNQHTELIFKYRKSGDKHLKKTLPLATVGGEFRNGRKLSDLHKPTGWLAIDIDYKDNRHFTCAEDIRDQISNIAYVAFSCLSVSGKGVWALIKIKDHNRQADYFEQLKVDFRHLKIHLDPTKGKNPNDARFLSYDPHAKLKSNFATYDRIPVKKTIKASPYSNHNLSSVLDFNHILSQVSRGTIDIAPDYETYRNIGFALASEFGEPGRQLFHDLVCYSPKYNFKDAETQYSKCLRSRGTGITLGTLIHYCKQNNIEIRR